MASNPYSKMYDVEIVGGDQRQRLAEMLRANALNMPQGQMVSGWYVPPSWSQNLAQLANTAVGVFGGQALDKEQKEKVADFLKRYEQGAPVQQEQKPTVFNNLEQMGVEGQTAFPNQPAQTELQKIAGVRPQSTEQSNMPAVLPQQQQPQYRPWTAQEKENMLMEAYQIDPRMAGVLGTRYDRDVAREEARALKAEQRAWQSEENRLNREARRDDKLFAAQLAASNRPEKNVTVLDTNTGMPFTIPQSQMQPGMTLYTPTTAKAFSEQKNKAEGQANVAEQIQGLRNEYNTLNKNMGITSEQNKVGSNIGAWASGTPAGQFTGRIFGTENATARDVIRMSRPGLMQSIVKASGMSAKQIDSNAELKLMLDQATDPTAGYEANMKALNSLEKRFAGGSQQQPITGMPDMNAIDAEIARRKGR